MQRRSLEAEALAKEIGLANADTALELGGERKAVYVRNEGGNPLLRLCPGRRSFGGFNPEVHSAILSRLMCVARFFSARCSLFGEKREKLTRSHSPRQMEDYAAIQLKEYRKTAKLMGVFRKPAAPGETKANANQEGKDVSDKDMAKLMASGMKRPRGS